MQLRRLLPATATLVTLLAAAARGQSTVTPNGSLSFTNGDLLVYRVGNGSAALSNTATPVFLDDYSTNGTLMQSVALPTSGGNLITAEGTAINEGQLSTSANGQYIAFTGYSEAVGGSKPSNTASSATQRVAATLSYNGTLTVENMGTSAFNANNVRSAYTTDGTNIWAAGAGGANGGVWLNNGTGATQITNAALRYVTAVSGNLVVNNGTALQQVGSSGLPTTGLQNTTNILTGLTGNSASFFAVDLGNSVAGLNTIYVTSTNSTSNSLQKFTLTSGNFFSGTWVQTGNIALGSLGNSNGTLGLVGVVNGSNVTIYGTSSSSLFDLTDSSGYDGTLSGTASLLASASGNEAFRGVTFAPESAIAVPEPGEMAAVMGACALGVAALIRRRNQREEAASEVA